MGRILNPAALGRRSDTATQRLILAALETSGAMLQVEICKTLGMHRNTVSRVINRLHEGRLVFVESWVHPEASNTLSRSWAVRTSDEQRDAPRPKPKPRVDVYRDYQQRHKARLTTRRYVKRATETNIWNGLLA